MQLRVRAGWIVGGLLAAAAFVLANPFPPLWQNGAGAAIHYQPVQWPNEPADPRQCGASCGDWKPYTRFGRSINDPRVQDPSNGGTAPQNYVNVASSCTDKAAPSIYYYLHKDLADPNKDVVMFRWRVEQAANNYATGPSAGNYSSSNPWSSALWTVLFDIDGSGYRTLAAHLDGSSGSPAEPIDMLAGIWSNSPTQSIDYTQPGIERLAHNPTAFIGPSNKIQNFQSSLTPTESWPNGATETTWDYGTTRARRVSTSPCSEYFIDYQIPVAMLDATSKGGPKITRDTPISMLFCTANSLNNPFQKDCAINRTWAATPTSGAPFGDYISFNKTQPYQQPIVSSVTAQAPTSCPGPYKLTAKVQDALALQNGVVISSVQNVDFYYWYDRNGDGEATAADIGSTWTRITPAATLQAQTMNTWSASWDASALAKGKYLVGVQALDDADALDDDMVSTGIDNRTFSYLSGDGENRIYQDGSWATNQALAFPAHSPALAPSNAENWYGNPSVTGNQVALVGTAINMCGIAPTIALSGTPTSVLGGATVSFTVTIANPNQNSNDVTLSSISNALPSGFTYVGGTSVGTNGIDNSDPTVNGQDLTWTFSTPINLAPGASATRTFSATATSTSGTYNDSASATTSFGELQSQPVAISVDSARVSLGISPSSFSVPADGTTPLTFTLRYANDSGVAVTNASISNPLPAGATYVSCSGGTSCGINAGTVTFSLGALSGGASGSVSYTLTVPNSWSTTSLTNTASFSAIAPDGSAVAPNASSSVAVTGLAIAGTPADFTLANTPSTASVSGGGTVTYTLTYRNFGATAATSVVLENTLPAGFAFDSCSDGCSTAGQVATWSLGTVAGGASGSRTITAIASAVTPFPAANPTTDRASVSWSGGSAVNAHADVGVIGQACSTYYFKNSPITINGATSAGAVAFQQATLATPSSGTAAGITRTATSGSGYVEFARFYQEPASASTVTFNGNLTTTFYVTKPNGPQLHVQGYVYDYDPVSNVATVLNTGGTPASFSNNGSATNTQYSFVIPLNGTLPKDHRLMWRFLASSNSSIEFTYLYDSTTSPTGATYCVTPPANLTLVNSASHSVIAQGTTPLITYTLRYSNAGGTTATNLSLLAGLPSGFADCEYSMNDTTWQACSAPAASPPSHTFAVATLAAGGSGTVYVRGTAPSGAPANVPLVSTATLISEQTSQISALAETDVVVSGGGSGAAALEVSLASNRTFGSPGDEATYTVSIVNIGDAAASNVVLTNALPVRAYYTYVNNSCTGSCDNTAGTLTWNIGNLAAGSSRTYTYRMAIGAASLPAGITTIADDATATATGLNATSNSVAVAIDGSAILAPTLTPTPATGLKPGDTITYTLSVPNTGAAPADGVTAYVEVPTNGSFIAITQGGGTFDAINNRVIFTDSSLAAGATATFEFTVRVAAPLPSGTTTLTNTGTVSATNASQQPVAASATASASPILEVTNSAPASVPYPAAALSSASAGMTLFVDRTDRLVLNQLIKVGSSVVRITGLSARSITVNNPVTAASGTPIHSAVTLAVTVRNIGDAPATAATVRAVLPAGLGYYATAPSAATSPISGNAGNVDWNIGTLEPGALRTFDVVAFPIATGSFTSTAIASASNATDASDSATIAIGGLSIAKTTSTPVRSVGSEATYTIVVANSLSTSVIATVRDVLPEGFTYKSNSATVAGVSFEPSFDASDTMKLRPNWDNVTVPANGALAIQFVANIAATAGAAAYQNEVEIDAPASIGVTSFDPLTSSAEDVTVLGASSGLLKGQLFRRTGSGTTSFDPAVDTPLAGVRIELYKANGNCATGVDCYVVYTDSNGYYEQVLPASSWLAKAVMGSGDLDSSWVQVTGANDNAVLVPNQGEASDQKGFRLPLPTHLVDTLAGTNGSISPISQSIDDGAVAAFTLLPDANYAIGTASGCNGSLVGTTYTTAPVHTACTVTVTFIANAGGGGGGPAQYTIAATAQPNGAGTINGSGTFAQGSAVTVTATAAVGYTFSHWSESSSTLSASTSYVFNATADRTLIANFALNTYTVAANATTGGAISPANVSVNHGSTSSFTATPATGYIVTDISGCGGTRNGNVFTTGAITSACTVTATFASLGPTIGTPAPASIRARALFTDVPLTLAPPAFDATGAPLPVELVGGPLKLRPGRHMLTWRAQDAQGRVVTAAQLLDIWPTVSLGPDLTLGYGNSSQIVATLNGNAPQYPYSVDFAVSGDGGLGSRHTLASGRLTFASGTQSAVTFDTLPQSGSPLAHRLTVTLDRAANLGERGEMSITLLATNAAPVANILVSQADRKGTLVARDGGTITLHADVIDPNVADTHVLVWTYPAGLLPTISTDGRDLSFDPTKLTAGIHDFSVTATDNGNPPLSNRARTTLALLQQAPVLGEGDANGNGIADRDEGWSDAGNGIPKYLNGVGERNVLPEDAEVIDRYLIESDAASHLRVGGRALFSGTGGARLVSAAWPTLLANDQAMNIGGIFDLEADDLALGQSVSIALPQRQPIPDKATYRLWDPQAQQWTTFIENSANLLKSAPGEAGYCPAPGSDAYQPGLSAGHWCVQVTLNDGGANDIDRQLNGALMKIGGVGVLTQTPQSTPETNGNSHVVTGRSKGGGGSMGAWLVALLAMLAGARIRRVASATIAVCAAATATAQTAEQKTEQPHESRGWYLGGQALYVRGGADADDMDARLARLGYETQTTLEGQNRFGGRLFGGYRWRALALELGYADLGELETRVSSTNPATAEYLRDVSRSHPQSGAGPQASVLAYWPLSEQLSLFGRLGLFYWQSDMSANDRSAYEDVDDRSTDLFVGLGIEYRVSRRWHAGFEWNGYELEGERIHTLGVLASYRFGARDRH